MHVLPDNIQELIAAAIPVDETSEDYRDVAEAYYTGFRDALESLALALSGTIPEGLLVDALNSALDAFANNVDNGFDDDGQPSEQQEWHDYDPDC